MDMHVIMAKLEDTERLMVENFDEVKGMLSAITNQPVAVGLDYEEDRYVFDEDEDFLGEGAYARVYKVKDRETLKVYAMKMISLEDFVINKDLARDIVVFSEFQHDNIVRSGGSLQLLMEHIPYSMSGALEQFKADFQDVTVVKDCLTQILSALAYLHDRGVMHLDLKPDNVLIAWKQDDLLDRKTRKLVVKLANGLLASPLPLKTLGTPTEEEWPGVQSLPNFPQQAPTYPNKVITAGLTDMMGIDLLQKLLCFNPSRRITAHDALEHPFLSRSIS